jgi:hypothetical protein
MYLTVSRNEPIACRFILSCSFLFKIKVLIIKSILKAIVFSKCKGRIKRLNFRRKGKRPREKGTAPTVLGRICRLRQWAFMIRSCKLVLAQASLECTHFNTVIKCFYRK